MSDYRLHTQAGRRAGLLRHIKSVCVSTGMVGHVSVTSEARQGVSAPGHKLAQVSGGVRELKICGTKTLKTTFFFPCRVAALWVSNHLPHTLSQLQSFSTPHVKLQVCYSSNILDTPKSPFSDAFFFSLPPTWKFSLLSVVAIEISHGGRKWPPGAHAKSTFVLLGKQMQGMKADNRGVEKERGGADFGTK